MPDPEFDDRTTAAAQGDEPDDAERQQASVVLYHREGATAVPLAAGRSVIVGRSPPSDVVLPDRSLSRRHLRLTHDEHGILVEDLGSTNGTRVDGEPIERARLRPGVELRLGDITGALQVLGPRDPELGDIDSEDRFASRLEHEVRRARGFGRSFGLLMVRSADADRAHVSRWCPRVRALLRPFDTVALYGEDAMLACLPEASEGEVSRIARAIVSHRPDETPLVCGAGSFPRSGGSADELIERVRRAARRAEPQAGIAWAEASSGPDPGGDPSPMIVHSRRMRELMQTLDRVADASLPVLVLGETGVGKELVARAIHHRSARRHRSLHVVHCGAIPTTLLESTLFGHERGAFTGADRRAAGAFEQADGGTLLLDEVGELSPSAQVALLRVLENKRLTRVGGTEEIAVDVRIIAATHRDLEAMCEQGQLRRDLFHRLDGFRVHVPPLRERTEEIEPLARRFLDEANRANGRSVREIDEEALEAMRAHLWPGNVRELRNAIERAVVVARGDRVTAADLPERVRRAGGSSPATSPVFERGDEPRSFKERIQDVERELIEEALGRHGGNQSAAARDLGIPLRTLVRKIRAFGLGGGEPESPG